MSPQLSWKRLKSATCGEDVVGPMHTLNTAPIINSIMWCLQASDRSSFSSFFSRRTQAKHIARMLSAMPQSSMAPKTAAAWTSPVPDGSLTTVSWVVEKSFPWNQYWQAIDFLFSSKIPGSACRPSEQQVECYPETLFLYLLISELGVLLYVGELSLCLKQVHQCSVPSFSQFPLLQKRPYVLTLWFHRELLRVLE